MRLPATRELASELGVSRNTVVAAYDALLAEGYSISVAGSGTRVAALPTPGAALCRQSQRAGAAEALDARRGDDGAIDGPHGPRPDRLPSRLPEIAGFPFATWARLLAATRAA